MNFIFILLMLINKIYLCPCILPVFSIIFDKSTNPANLRFNDVAIS